MIIYTKLIGPNHQFKLRTGDSCIEAAREMKEVSDLFKSTVEESYRQLEACPMSTTKMLIGVRESFTMRKDESLNPDQVFRFFAAYYAELDHAFATVPENYTGSIDNTYNRMCYAILDGSFSKESVPFKSACKVLKIKHTYKAIQAYLRGEA